MRQFKIAMVWIALLSMLAVTFSLLSLLRPELVNSSLRTELSATGLVVGRDKAEQMMERHGLPSRTVQEHLTTKYEYAPTGILFRVDNTTGLLNWVEFTGSAFRTGKGIGVGDLVESVRRNYGKPMEQVEINGFTRLRYAYGISYSLEFWISAAGNVERVLFYRR